ncbi:MAG: dienelactone hydrolase family protein [Nitrososphaerales archaeon]
MQSLFWLCATERASGESTEKIKASSINILVIILETTSSMIEIPWNDRKIPAHISKPSEGVPRAALILIHEIFGLDAHMKDVASRFAEEGYVALVPELFTPAGPLSGEGFEAARERAQKMYDKDIVSQLEASHSYLASTSETTGKKVGVVGWCWGGRSTMLYAFSKPAIDAAIVFYGRPINMQASERTPVSPIDIASNLPCPLLGIFGQEDQSIPLDQVKRLEDELRKTGQSIEIKTYPGAGHAFFNDTRPQVYREEAAKDAWVQTLAFYSKNLG